ncbi:hypothetical protein CEUSTIGMA_g8795.t1 [Chlamydomonas eustigma]|uniref:T-complex protein 11 n=1 Tax=Chlamydomonas eustigma TaxID=1157962 RepID=A0A250XE57_9CHLO|nr:hypothetical protein CEUSTIGMA_g8795.t1 [Chlamydomonas eustigma]|eukprot:GAX81364.1 hypothetical protein CEUSTIGMA_g8795.t1 [Chlamydomonas eustigma]
MSEIVDDELFSHDTNPKGDKEEIRRQEFRLWIADKSRREWQVNLKSGKRLQERLDQASAAHAEQLEQRRLRASHFLQRRELALARRQQHAELQSKAGLPSQAELLQSAAERRQSLLETQQQRLRQEHSLVMERLALSRENNNGREENLRNLEQKLEHAEEVRFTHVGSRAMRAGARVAKARSKGALSLASHQQAAELKRKQLEERLRLAEERRLAALATSPKKSTRSPTKLQPSSHKSLEDFGLRSPPLHDLTSAGHHQEETVELDVEREEEQVTETGLGNEEPEAGVDDLRLRVDAFRRRISCLRLQQCWRSFVRKHRTTHALAAAFVSSGITSVLLPETSASSTGREVGEPRLRHGSADYEVKSPAQPVAIIGMMKGAEHGSGSSQDAASDAFELFATALRSSANVKAAQALLYRLEERLLARGMPVQNCSRQLHRLFPSNPAYKPQRHDAVATSLRRYSSSQSGGTGSQRPERYPARVFLSAWMIVKYPGVVFHKRGSREDQLAEAAGLLVVTFERLLQRLVEPLSIVTGQSSVTSSLPVSSAGSVMASTAAAAAAAAAGVPVLPPSPLTTDLRTFRNAVQQMRVVGLRSVGQGVGKGGRRSLEGNHNESVRSGSEWRVVQDQTFHGVPTGPVASLLLHFDQAWLQYLDQFVVWKTEDAAALEGELVGMAAKLERSYRRKLVSPPGGGGPNGAVRARAVEDLQAMKEQVENDHNLLRERIAKLSGAAGLARLDSALTAAREADPLEPSSAESTASVTSESDSSPVKKPHHGLRPPPLQQSEGSREGAVGPPEPAAEGVITTKPPPPPPGPRKAGMARGFFNSAKQPTKRSADAPTTSSAQSSITTTATGAVSAGSLAQVPGISAEALANLSMVNDLLHSPSAVLPTDELESELEALMMMGDRPAISNPQPAGPADPQPSPSADPAALLVDPQELEGLSPEEVMALIKRRSKAVAEKVFWTSVQSKIHDSLKAGNLLEVSGPLAVEVGRELAAVISNPDISQRLSHEFGPADLEPRQLARKLEEAYSTTPVLDSQLHVLLQLLERLGGLLIEYGAPAREASSRGRLQKIREELKLSLLTFSTRQSMPSQSEDNGNKDNGESSEQRNSAVAMMALSLSRALHVLHMLLRQVKLDSANAKLSMLSASLQGGSSGVQYVRDKFLSLYGLSSVSNFSTEPSDKSVPSSSQTGTHPPPSAQRIAAFLPKTWAWVQQAARALPAMRTYFSGSLNLDIDLLLSQLASNSSTMQQSRHAGIPTELKSGRGATLSKASHAGGVSDPHMLGSGAEVRSADVPVPMSSMSGVVRAGLISLVSGGKPAAGPALPELLMLDVERLHGLQNQFQSLVVMAASFLLVQQFRSQRVSAARAAAVAAAGIERDTGTQSTFMEGSPVGGAATRTAAVLPAAWDPKATKQRLQILLADPSLQIHRLVTELAVAAGIHQVGVSLQEQLAAEGQLKQALLKLVDPAGPAFRSLSNALAASLLLMALTGARLESGESLPSPSPSDLGGAGLVPSVGELVSRLLGRVGGGMVATEVSDLARRLLSVSAVLETVHGESVLTHLWGHASELQEGS